VSVSEKHVALAPSASTIGAARLTRDQQRALHAYGAVLTVPPDQQRDYKIAVSDLAVGIRRSGLSAALAALERKKGAGGRLLCDLAKAGMPALKDATAASLVAEVNRLDVDAYILASRECLKVAAWLKRATHARFEVD
jgi:CRISPR-associated protein Cmr5